MGYIHLEVYKLSKWWTDLWMAIAGGSPQQYLVIKGMDVVEFWRIYEGWQKKQAEKIKHG